MNKQDTKVIININKRFFRIVAGGILFLSVLFLFYLILPYSGIVMTPLILSVLFAFLLNPVVIRLERNGVNRTGAVGLIIMFLILVIGLILIWFYPSVSEEIFSITQVINNKNYHLIFNKVKTIITQIQELPFIESTGLADTLTERFQPLIFNLFRKSLDWIPNIFSILIAIVLIPFMTFFLLKDAPQMKKSFIKIIPNRYFEMALILIYKINNQLGSYIRGQLLVSLCIGSLSIIALYLLDVPYFFSIGLVAGLANMIPYFGPITGAVPAIIINYIDKKHFSAVIVVIIAFAVIRLIDDTIISPNILARSVEIHPLLVIIVIFIGGNMFGLLGLLLCIPVTGIIKLTVKELVWSFKNYHLYE